MGPLGPLKKSLRSGPKGPLGPLGPLKKSLRSGIHARNPPKMVGYTFYFMPGKAQWTASPPIFAFSGYERKGVADHFGGFRAWILERSDFFKGPKGPKGPERSDFFKRPKGPLGPPVATWGAAEGNALLFLLVLFAFRCFS